MIDMWIKAHYQGIETVYIIHDAVAHEVDEHTVLPHALKVGGTEDQLRRTSWPSRSFRSSDIRPTSGTCMPSTFPTATTGATTCPTASNCLETNCCHACEPCLAMVRSKVPFYGSGEFYEHVNEIAIDEHAKRHRQPHPRPAKRSSARSRSSWGRDG